MQAVNNLGHILSTLFIFLQDITCCSYFQSAHLHQIMHQTNGLNIFLCILPDISSRLFGSDCRKLFLPISQQSFRNINLADAAVSLLSLQVTLVAVFSDGTDGAMNALNAVTGFAVCALTLALGVFMIVRANARLKKIKEEGF